MPVEHELKVGVFVVPDAENRELTVDQVVAADASGLDVVGIQDHPYQRRFFDTWTLLSYLAARTERIALVPDVANLPLRQPAVLAKSAASLDLLSAGRVELGLGAGAFWEAIEAMGGPRRSAKEAVDALEEAPAVIRATSAGSSTPARSPHTTRTASCASRPTIASTPSSWVPTRTTPSARSGASARTWRRGPARRPRASGTSRSGGTRPCLRRSRRPNRGARIGGRP